MNNFVKVSAPGKIILSGEHAVVHGFPALVASVSLRSYVKIEKIKKPGVELYPATAKEILSVGIKNFEKYTGIKVAGVKISLESRIPIGSGMGSSASISVSLAGVLYKFVFNKFDPEEIFKIANLTEGYYHKKSSGVDPTICTYGGFLWYRKETENLKLSVKLNSTKLFDNLVIFNSGKPLETTGEMVSRVAERLKKYPSNTNKIFRSIEKLTRNFINFADQTDGLSLGRLISENGRYLEELGVVSVNTKRIIRDIEKLGGSAKIAGAGGYKEDSGMLIAYHPEKRKLLNFLKTKNIEPIKVNFGVEGVRIEN